MAASLTSAAQNSVFSLVVRCVKDQKTITDLLSINPSAGSPEGGLAPSADAWGWAQEVNRFWGNIAAGTESVNACYADGLSSGFATGTITFTGNPADEDTVTIAGVVISFETTAAAGTDEVAIGATQAATMANLVAFLNAGGNAGDLCGIVTATKTATVITVNSFYPGPVGNLITMAKSCANISAITATLAGGTGVNQASLLSIGI